MDKQSKELAKLSADIFHREVSPGYIEVRQQLLGELSVAGTAYEAIQQETLERKANYDLMASFIGGLPAREEHSRGTETTFKVNGLESVHALQKSVVWLASEYGDDFNMARPYYVVGSRTNGTGELLLFCPENIRDTRLAKVSAPSKKIKAILSLMNPYETNIDESALHNKLYDPKSNRLQLGADSPGSIFLRSNLWWISTENFVGGSGHSKADSAIFTVRGKNIERDMLGITDAEWAKYNAQDHLNQIAMLFNKKQLLDEVFSSHK